MTAPHAILVVPAVGDPGGLLAAGLCGSRPPTVSQYTCGLGHVSRWRLEQWVHPHCPAEHDKPAPHICFRYGVRVDALPLWWDGALVPEGWDRARRVWWNAVRVDARERTCFEMVQPCHTVPVVVIAEALVATGLASRVVLLDLVDGALLLVLAERAP